MIAMILLYLLNGGSADLGSAALLDIVAARSRVDAAIELPADRNAVLEALDAMEMQITSHRGSLRTDIAAVSKEMSAADPDIATIKELLDQEIREMRSHNSKMLDLRFALRDRLSREQWEVLFAQPDSH